MKKFEITQEQILELEKFGSLNKLKDWFPEAFEKPLEAGKWYKEPSINGAKFRYLFLQDLTGKGYGFDGFGDWQDNLYYCNIKDWQEATPQEVETALIAEAKKRGYEKDNFNSLIETSSYNFDGWYFNKNENRLYSAKKTHGGKIVFENGNWAEICQETITKEEAEKLLNKKIV